MRLSPSIMGTLACHNSHLNTQCMGIILQYAFYILHRWYMIQGIGAHWAQKL